MAHHSGGSGAKAAAGVRRPPCLCHHGPRGCYFANHSGSGTTACPTGIHVLDTTGAGDIFGGSAMSRLLKLDKAPEALSAEEMSAITRFACCAASLSTRHHGGINSIPEEQEVLELMRQG